MRLIIKLKIKLTVSHPTRLQQSTPCHIFRYKTFLQRLKAALTPDTLLWPSVTTHQTPPTPHPSVYAPLYRALSLGRRSSELLARVGSPSWIGKKKKTTSEGLNCRSYSRIKTSCWSSSLIGWQGVMRRAGKSSFRFKALHTLTDILRARRTHPCVRAQSLDIQHADVSENIHLFSRCLQLTQTPQ